jgi:1D-myo-inositol-tetrakisphosphate 5-kinase/inositol-polyphosphate multikinase
MGGSQVGYQTWYPNADPSYIQRCQIKDEQTTQATFGFKICGMQVCLPQKINRYEQP